MIAWYKRHQRDLPWRNIEDAYRIWLSEIILQQTRIQQGLPYYERFIKEFPSVYDFANASEDQILKLWEGLGYYSRARNMHKAAKLVAYELNGIFPSDIKDLLALPGIGPYTAGAISSFAYKKKEAIVDGNVQRVYARYFGIDEIPNSSKGQKVFWDFAHQIIEQVSEPHHFNSALMDLGSMVCKAQNPECDSCPLHNTCSAYKMNDVEKFPSKKIKAEIKERTMVFGLIEKDGCYAVQRRSNNDIWAGLYQFPLLIDSENPILKSSVVEDYKLLHECKHRLTHRLLHIEVRKCDEHTFNTHDDWDWLTINDLRKKAFPRPLKKILDTIF